MHYGFTVLHSLPQDNLLTRHTFSDSWHL